MTFSARRTAASRLKPVPVLVRLASMLIVHFHPVGLAVWTTAYWIPLNSMTVTSYSLPVIQRSAEDFGQKILIHSMSYMEVKGFLRLKPPTTQISSERHWYVLRLVSK